MQVRKVAGLVLCSLCLVISGGAQSPDIDEKPVWTLEYIHVMPDKLGLTLGYLDHWMHVRKEAKRRGIALSYHRIQEVQLVTPGSKTGDPNSIVLPTEYKNLAAFSEREKLFASILDERGPKSTPGVISAAKPEELYATVDTRTFMEQPAGPNTTQFKLLAKP